MKITVGQLQRVIREAVSVTEPNRALALPTPANDAERRMLGVHRKCGSSKHWMCDAAGRSFCARCEPKRMAGTLVRESLADDQRRKLAHDGAIVSLVRTARSYAADTPGCTFEELLDIMREVNDRISDEKDED